MLLSHGDGAGKDAYDDADADGDDAGDGGDWDGIRGSKQESVRPKKLIFF